VHKVETGVLPGLAVKLLLMRPKGNTEMYTEPEFTKLQNEIEALLDRHPIDELVAALAEVCDHKADHVMSNWQDKHLAKLWQRNAIALNQVQAKLQATF
jgi:hypothetical protein